MPDLPDMQALRDGLERLAAGLGFSALGVADIALDEDEQHLRRWLEQGRHGAMHYMARHGMRRARPAELKPGTIRVISVRMDYWPAEAAPAEAVLADAERAYVSRYALGRDYHKLMRNRLQRFAERIEAQIGPFGYRVFVDSGPVLEKALARNAGLGWIGKHTNLIAREAGSWFFLGELYTDLPLPADGAGSSHCGSCEACMPACPTGAITAPWQLDARRCISYLTIENKGHIPAEFRAPIGNRIYGCDDCLAACPWNKYAVRTADYAFLPRVELTAPKLADLAGLDDEGFRQVFSGSPIKRIGRDRFVRNVLIAIGNSTDASLIPVAETLAADASPLVRAMAAWALKRLLPADRFARLAAAHADEADEAVRAEWVA